MFNASLKKITTLLWQRSVLSSIAVITVAITITYANSFQGTWVLDDKYIVIYYPPKGLEWPPWDMLKGLKESPSAGRPLVSLSLALNFAAGGQNPWGYHLVNLLIHLSAALLLFGVIRRTLVYSDLPPPLRNRAVPFALVCSLIWALHPLQTESVTYVSQRSESMMGMFYLLMMYCAIRGFWGSHKQWWFAGATMACTMGVLSKEVVATAPVVMLLYDRAFVSKSLKDLFVKHRLLYLGLVATWFIVIGLLFTAPRVETTGYHFADRGLGILNYLGTQCNAIVMYLKLTLWPHPLVLDYGDIDGGYPIVQRLEECLFSAVFLSLAALAGIYLLWKCPPWGFLIASFFIILSPSSSIVPIATELVAEHRMYLPLASVVIMGVAGVVLIGERFSTPLHMTTGSVQGILAGTAAAVIIALAITTCFQNRMYHSESRITIESVKEYPDNQRAQYNAGCALAVVEKRYEESIPYFKAVISLKWSQWHLDARNNLSIALITLGRFQEGFEHLAVVLYYNPNRPEVLLATGNVLAKLGKYSEATASYKKALALKPEYEEVRSALVQVLVSQGHMDEARSYQSLIKGIPDRSPNDYYEMGTIMEGIGRFDEANKEYGQAVEKKPDFAQAVFKQGFCLYQIGRVEAAFSLYEKTLRLNPDHPDAHNNIGFIYANRGDMPDAVIHFRKAIKSNPQKADYYSNLGNALSVMGKKDEAAQAFREARFLGHDTSGTINNAISSPAQASGPSHP